MGDETDEENVTIPLQRHERDKLTEYIDVDAVHESRADEVAAALQSIDGTWEMRSHDEDGLRAINVGRRINRRVKNVVENGGTLT